MGAADKAPDVFKGKHRLLVQTQEEQELLCWLSWKVIETSEWHRTMNYHIHFIKEDTEVKGNSGLPEIDMDIWVS